MKRMLILLFLVISVFTAASTPALAASSPVALVSIKGEINEGQVALLRRALSDAQERNAQVIIVEMDTFGGLVDAAVKIRDMINETPMTTICYIKNRAWSAGALIALSHRHIVMAPGGSIGAAEPIPATEKNIAALKAEFSATANRHGRNSKLAEAMVDKSMGYLPYAQPGQIVALTDTQAVEAGYADMIASNRADLLDYYKVSGQEIVEYHASWSEKLVGWVSEPAVKSFLLSMMFLAVFVEIKTAGMGIAALIGTACALLFFGSQWLSGVAGWLEVVLFFIGVIMIAMEMVTPGVGIWGFGGIICILASLFLVLGANTGAILMMTGSLAGAIIVFILIARYFPSSRFWERLMLKESQSNQGGFTSSQDYSRFLGKTGVAVTLLRPSGTACIEGVKLNVVSSGQFISQGTTVKVVNVEGNRIVVETAEFEK